MFHRFKTTRIHRSSSRERFRDNFQSYGQVFQQVRFVRLVLELLGFIECFFFSISKESIIDVEAKVAEVQGGVAGCTQSEIELVASQIWVVSLSLPQLPLQIEDASRPEKPGVR